MKDLAVQGNIDNGDKLDLLEYVIRIFAVTSFCYLFIAAAYNGSLNNESANGNKLTKVTNTQQINKQRK